MFKPKPRSLRASLVRAFLNAVVMTCSLAGGYLLVTAVSPGITFAAPEDPAVVERPPAPGSPAALLAKHDCWTGEAPADMAGKWPGKAVVTVAGETRVYRTPVAVGTALDAAFGKPTEIETVHGFCR